MTDRLNRRQFVAQTAALAGGTAALITAPSLMAADNAWGDLVGRLVYEGSAGAQEAEGRQRHRLLRQVRHP